MIRLTLPLILMLSVQAGVGGIAGGTEKFQRGNSIHFQEFSTWVNVLYSKTLCQNDYDYEAVIRICKRWQNSGNDSTCSDWQKIVANQPKESKKFICKSYQEGDCKEWTEVTYVQSPKRIVEIKDDNGSVKKRFKLTVPQCK